MLVRSRRKSAPVLRLESLEQRLAPAGFFLHFETQITITLFANTFPPSHFGDSARTVVTQPSTPAVQPPPISLIDSFRLIVSDLISSFDNSLARASTLTPDASSAAAGSGAGASSSSAAGISAALRGTGGLLTNVGSSTGAPGLTGQFFDAFGILRALAQTSTPVPVNSVRPLLVNSLSDSLALAVPNSPTGLKRLEPGRFSFSDQFGEQGDNKAGEMGRLPKADVNPDQPMPQPDKTNPDKGADQNKPAAPEVKPELPEETKPAEEETAAQVLSLTWVDPTDTPEQQPVTSGMESLRNYAATMTVALAMNGWWNRSPSVPEEKERRRMAMRLRG